MLAMLESAADRPNRWDDIGKNRNQSYPILALAPTGTTGSSLQENHGHIIL